MGSDTGIVKCLMPHPQCILSVILQHILWETQSTPFWVLLFSVKLPSDNFSLKMRGEGRFQCHSKQNHRLAVANHVCGVSISIVEAAMVLDMLHRKEGKPKKGGMLGFRDLRESLAFLLLIKAGSFSCVFCTLKWPKISRKYLKLPEIA